ncbi:MULTISPECIES: MBL fold metallo-hydrolase [Shouchella]|uniref:MBL fold metallo-hydrolase n=2 Tax=Shouchella TaxID=2893057 RepID=A0ABY7W6Q0_9BACI|nr:MULTISPECIES: MBL fold metallo-hydrolase [Shouchella]MED4126703.1 MBL fold metallo-hydrolase [Shouchella miscanthi]WDF04598.1 MBL fold metallo-hydrolase [Shouchella hunanensis]
MKKQRFENLNGVQNQHQLKDFVSWYRERMSKTKDLTKTIAVKHQPDYRLIHNANVDSLTWIGHATFLIRINGLTVVTDPVWTNFMGTTKRNVPVTIPIQHLPEIDVVLISHGHYDHLHIQSLRHLPGDPLFLIPRGLKALLKKKGFLEERIVELDWWEEWSNQNVTLTFVPAQHWVKRGLFDTNTSRWGGWVLESTAQSLYFAGDSGYFEGFKQLQKIKSIDYALVPIGAYEPEWFMELDHMKPEDAVQAFIDLGASHMVPMHYGTFRLADDTGPEALERFEQAWKEKGINEKKKSVLPIGGTLRL